MLKRILLIFLTTFCLTQSLFSQTIPPPYINYQAVLYDVNGPNTNAVLANQSFATYVNIQDELGNLLYKEEHYASTDANGQVTVKIGDGVYMQGTITNFNQINWGSGKYYLIVDFDINGTISSTAPEQLVTVPYSFYAGKAGNGMTAVADNGNGTLTFTYANGQTYMTPTLSGIQGSIGPAGPQGQQGVPGPAGPMVAGTSGQTLRHEGSTWVATDNLYNSGNSLGIGTSNPSASSILDVSSTDKGLLIPRLALEQSNSASPVTNPANSLLVYNTATVSDITPGYYYWDISQMKWIKLATASGGGPSGTCNYTIGMNSDMGGYIVYVTPDGCHGLVAGTTDILTRQAYMGAMDAIKNMNNHDANGKKFYNWRLPTLYELNLLRLYRDSIGGFVKTDVGAGPNEYGCGCNKDPWYWSTTYYYTTNNAATYVVSFRDNEGQVQTGWLQSCGSGSGNTMHQSCGFRVRAVREF